MIRWMFRAVGLAAAGVGLAWAVDRWMGGRQHADDGISDLILDQLRIAARPFGEHDHLHVGQIGNGIQAHALDGDDAGDDEKHDAHHH